MLLPIHVFPIKYLTPFLVHMIKWTYTMLTIFFTIFFVNERTNTSIYNLCNASMSKSRQFDNVMTKFRSITGQMHEKLMSIC